MESLPAQGIPQKKQSQHGGGLGREPGLFLATKFFSFKNSTQPIFLAATSDILKWTKQGDFRMKMKEVLAWLNASLQFWVCLPLTSKTNHNLSKKACFNQNTEICCNPEVPSD